MTRRGRFGYALDVQRLPKFVFATAVAIGTLLAAPAAVSAQAYPGGITEERKPDPGGDVLGTTAEQEPAQVQPAEVQGVQETRGLAVTGGDVLGLTAMGGALITAGAVMVRRSRRLAAVPA